MITSLQTINHRDKGYNRMGLRMDVSSASNNMRNNRVRKNYLAKCTNDHPKQTCLLIAGPNMGYLSRSMYKCIAFIPLFCILQEEHGYASSQAPQIVVEPPHQQNFNNMQPGWSSDKPTEKGDAGL